MGGDVPKAAAAAHRHARRVGDAALLVRRAVGGSARRPRERARRRPHRPGSRPQPSDDRARRSARGAALPPPQRPALLVRQEGEPQPAARDRGEQVQLATRSSRPCGRSSSGGSAPAPTRFAVAAARRPDPGRGSGVPRRVPRSVVGWSRREARDERLRELFERRGAGSNRAYRNAIGFALRAAEAIEHARQAARRCSPPGRL